MTWKNEMTTLLRRALHYVECYQDQFPSSGAKFVAEELFERIMEESPEEQSNLSCPSCQGEDIHRGVWCFDCGASYRMPLDSNVSPGKTPENITTLTIDQLHCAYCYSPVGPIYCDAECEANADAGN